MSLQSRQTGRRGDDTPSSKYSMRKWIIEKVVDESGTYPFEGATYPDDLAIRFHLRNDAGWTREHRVSGNVTFSSEGEITSWKPTGWRLEVVFRNLGILFGRGGIPEISDKKPYVPEEALGRLEDMEIVMLSYVSRQKEDGSGYWYRNYWQIAGVKANGGVDEARRIVEAAFLREVERGYPKNYHPELVESKVERQSSKAVESHHLLADDDLPF